MKIMIELTADNASDASAKLADLSRKISDSLEGASSNVKILCPDELPEGCTCEENDDGGVTIECT